MTIFHGDSYAQVMSEEPTHLSFKLEHKSPIEIGDFVSSFVGLGDQYEKYLTANYPALSGRAKIYVKKVESGSIIAELIPLMQGTLGPAITMMDSVLILRDFVHYTRNKVAPYFKTDGRLEDANKSDLKDVLNTISAVANDPNGKAVLEAVSYKDGKRQIEADFVFKTSDAQQALIEIEAHKKEMDAESSADHERVLMVFTRTDIHDATVGKKSVDRVVIEEISKKPLALIYASQLAEDQIKDEIRADDSVYKKGFVVDVNVNIRKGNAVAYSVTNVHQIIDLPNDN